MQFEVRQAIAAPVDRVLATLASVDFYGSLAGVPGVAAPTLRDRRQDGDTVQLILGFAFDGVLPSIARAVVDPDKLTWAVELTVHLDRPSAEFVLVPDHYPDLMQGSGAHRFVDRGSSTERVTDGDLVVRVPLFGGRAEEAIVDGFRRYLLAEGDHLAAGA
ncbi:MAG TPA: DUF2505 family protein [Acidimicrobiales bacterium]|nr:DUF2505 family protein [Acidimicrobiales bacterium]